MDISTIDQVDYGDFLVSWMVPYIHINNRNGISVEQGWSTR